MGVSVLLAELGKRRGVHTGEPELVHLGTDRMLDGGGRRDGRWDDAGS